MKIFTKALGIICAAALLLCSLSVGFSAFAASFSISSLFSDGAILQQNVPVKISGFGETGASVTVSLSAYNAKTETVTCTVNERGKWTAEFTPRNGSYTKYTVTAKSGKTTLRSTGILFGEVWIAGGESSMTTALSEEEYNAQAKAVVSERAAVCVVSAEESGEITESELDSASFCWTACSGKGAVGLPEIPALFAMTMRRELNLPVGVVCVTSGTSSVAAWLGASAINTDLQSKLKDAGAYDTADPDYYPSSLYNRLLAPVRGIYASGVLWAAGEGDRGNSELLFSCADALVSQMRGMLQYDSTKAFTFMFAQNKRHLDDFTTSAVNNALISAAAKYPFAYTLPVYDLDREPEAPADTSSDAASLAETSSDAESSETSSDSSQNEPLLPDYPERGALWSRFCGIAASRHYKTAAYAFPSLLKADCDETGAELLFGDVGGGLVSRDGTRVEGFCLIYADTRTVIPVSGEITGPDTVKLTFGSDLPLSGVSLGYAYGDCAGTADLMTEDGIPAMPFDRAVNLLSNDMDPLVPSAQLPSQTVSQPESSGEDARTMLIVIICIGAALLIAGVGIVVALKVSKKNNSII